MQSNLSSPFIEKMRLADEQIGLGASVSSESILVTPQPKSLAEGFLSPVQLLEEHPEIIAAGESSAALLTEPFFPADAGPSREAGGELARLREEMAQAENARISELERRRPEYLKRRRRAEDQEPLDLAINVDGTENEGVGMVMGLMENPGRLKSVRRRTCRTRTLSHGLPITPRCQKQLRHRLLTATTADYPKRN